MSEDGLGPRPHVARFGKALEPLLGRIDVGLAEPVCPMGERQDLIAECQLAALEFQLSLEVVRTLLTLINNADNFGGEIFGDFEGSLSQSVGELVDSYSRLCALRPESGHEHGHALLLTAYRGWLTQLRRFLGEQVEAIADPVATLRKQGLPTDGSARVGVSLDLTAPPELAELMDWVNRNFGGDE